jgi:hypothetical protein
LPAPESRWGKPAALPMWRCLRSAPGAGKPPPDPPGNDPAKTPPSLTHRPAALNPSNSRPQSATQRVHFGIAAHPAPSLTEKPENGKPPP